MHVKNEKLKVGSVSVPGYWFADDYTRTYLKAKRGQRITVSVQTKEKMKCGSCLRL